MKKATSKKISRREDMRPEYDFSGMKGAVRGKYYKSYRAGHKVVIHPPPTPPVKGGETR